jgi:medium-chain acyl-[acyl-carrier-protein] hydrolase
MNPILKQNFQIRTQEIDQHKVLTTPSLIMLMQEASMQSAINLKASVWDLEESNASWVLLRKELKIYRLPTLGENIEITTYPAGFDRIFAYRDFKVHDQDGQLLATAASTWALMNLITRKMVRIPVETFGFNVAENVDFLPHPKSKIPLLSEAEMQREYMVHWYDLDWNGHVNNQFLTRCLLETAPDEYLKERILDVFSIHFKAESFWKDDLRVSFQKLNDQQTVGQIIRLSDGKEIAHSHRVWK